MNFIVEAVSGLLKPASKAYGKFQDRKIAGEAAVAKVRQARVDNKQELAVTQLELEIMSKKMEGGTWKDEYSLVLGSSPYLLILVGGILSAFGEPAFLAGVLNGLNQIRELGVPIGEICVASITAGLGLRLIRR